MFDVISSAIAAISAMIAVISVIIVTYQTKRSWYISVISPQRLEWAERVREAVSDFSVAYYKGEDLRAHRARIMLYLNPGNKRHTLLIEAIKDVCDRKQDDMDEVIVLTQKLLRWNWWVVKSETTTSRNSELRRDKIVQKRAEWHEKRQESEMGMTIISRSTDN